MPFLWQQPHLLSGPLLSLSVSLSVAAVAPKVKCQCSQLCPSPPYPATPCPSPHLPTANNAKPPTKATPVTFFCLFFLLLFSLLFCLFGLLLCSYLCSKARAGEDAARFRAPGNSCQPGYVCGGWGIQLTHARRGGEGEMTTARKAP